MLKPLMRGEQREIKQTQRKQNNKSQSLGALRTPSKDNEDKETTPSQSYTRTNTTTHNNGKTPVKY